MTKATDMLNVGEIDNARELVFKVDKESDRLYVLTLPDTDYLETLHRYPKHQIERTSQYYIDDTSGQWFACYNVDCFDPPMAIIRARSFESAYEVFCCEFEHWLKVEELDAADYPEEDRNYNDNGTHIDTNNVQIHKLILVRVNMEIAL